MAAIAEERKKAKYTCLSSYHIFTPVAVETAGVFGPETSVFLRELSGRLRRFSGEEKSHAYLYSNDCQWQYRGETQLRCWELSSRQHTLTLFSNLNVLYVILIIIFIISKLVHGALYIILFY